MDSHVASTGAYAVSMARPKRSGLFEDIGCYADGNDLVCYRQDLMRYFDWRKKTYITFWLVRSTSI